MPTLNKTRTAADRMAVRAIDETMFRKSLLALQTAIESAGNDTGRPPGLDSEPHSLVEQARPSAESLVRPDPRGV
jgi:hypothetical protein